MDYDAETKTYALGPQVLQLGYGYLAARDLVEVAMPHLVRLRDRTGWSAHLGELHGRDVVYLRARRHAPLDCLDGACRHAAAGARHHHGPNSAVGLNDARGAGALSRRSGRQLRRQEPARFPACSSSSLPIAPQGAVVQNSGYEPGVASIAAPVRDMTGRVVAAINISAVALFTNDAELNGPLKAEVIAAAEAISRDLGRKAAGNSDDKDLGRKSAR